MTKKRDLIKEFVKSQMEGAKNVDGISNPFPSQAKGCGCKKEHRGLGPCCGCKVSSEWYETIEFCPLHANAERMREQLYNLKFMLQNIPGSESYRSDIEATLKSCEVKP